MTSPYAELRKRVDSLMMFVRAFPEDFSNSKVDGMPMLQIVSNIDTLLRELSAEHLELKSEARLLRTTAEGYRCKADKFARLAEELAQELEDELTAKYEASIQYESQRKRFERDMCTVYETRAALASGGTDE